ncbi:MAG: adenosylcobinamide-GDP ribazoletransferase [Lachnospiraceae bacterium]
MVILQSLVIALSMYSKIPMPRIAWTEDNTKHVMCFFPVVGIITGVCVWGAGTFLLRNECGVLLFSSVMTVLPVAVNGGIHMDGLLDTIDALSSYGDREKKLEILKDSHAGAFAIIGACCYFILCLGLWSEVTEDMLPVIACGYVLSRGMSGFAILTFPSASEKGLARTFKEGTRGLHAAVLMILYILIPAAGMFILSPGPGLLAVAGAAGTFACYRVTAVRRFGGVTGDLAGYFLQLCELAVLGCVAAGGIFM